MQTSAYVALSGQLALDRRMQALAQNIANARTSGYRSEILDFNSVISVTGPHETKFTSSGKTHVNPESGGLSLTKNPLDLAARGEGFFAYQSATGIYYSRDGRLLLTPDGRLLNTSGEPVLDSGGAQLQLDPAVPDITIDDTGVVSQAGSRKGQIGLYRINLDAGFVRHGNSGFVPKTEAEPVIDFTREGMLQGYIEESNVNPAFEMTRLIQITRAFEAVSTLAERTFEAEKSAIEILGSKN
jgi:flagellar basal-body rod protein FlgF